MPGRRTLLDRALWVGVGVAVLYTFGYRLLHWHGMALDYDDGVYWQTGLALGDGAPAYRQVFHAQPPLFAWLLGVPFRWTGDATAGVEAARLLMTGFAVLLAVVAGGISTTLRGARAGMLAALGVAAIPLIQRYGIQFGADIPAAALGGLALWSALRARVAGPSGRKWLWTATGVFIALAALVKLIAIVVVPAVLLALVTVPAEPGAEAERSPWWRRTATVAAWSALGFGLTTGLVLFALQPPHEAWSQVFGFHVAATGQATGGGLAELVTWPGPWSLPLLISAAVAAVICLVRPAEPGQRTAVLSVTLWAVALVPLALLHHPTFPHHLLLFMAPCVVLIAVAVTDLWAGLERRWTAVTAVVVVVLACVGVVWQARDVAVGSYPRVSAMETCLRTLPAGLTVVGDDQGMLARAGLRTPPWLVDTSLVRLDAGDLTDAELIAETKDAAGALLSSYPRLSSRKQLVDWLDANLAARYTAGRATLYVHDPSLLAGCSGPD